MNMKDFINSINYVTREMAEGRLNCDMVRDIPEERLSTKPYVFTISFDLFGMERVQLWSTIFYCAFLALSYFMFGVTGAVYFFVITGVVTLYSSFVLHKRSKEMVETEYPFKKMIDNGEYDISPPYIFTKTEEARKAFKHIILYTHYLFDNTLYEMLQKSMAATTTSMFIITAIVVAMLLSVPSYPLAYAFVFYFASRGVYELIRLGYTRLMVRTVQSFHEAAHNKNDQLKEP